MQKMELIFIPAENGMIKVYIYGFLAGGYGKVFATYRDFVVSSKGYNKRRTIVKALSKLTDTILKQN